MSRVVVVGSANMDLVVSAACFPLPGETLLGHGFASHPGGKGANAAVAAGRMGSDIAFVGMLGPDAFGDALASSLEGANVSLEYTLRAEATPTGVALITVSDGGENTIVVAPGANALVAPEDVEAALSALDPAVTLVSLEIPLAAVAACAAAPGFLILNPAPAADLPNGLWKRIDLLTPNEAETRFYTDVDPVDDEACLKAAHVFFAKGARCVLITLGKRGSFLATPEMGRPFPNLEVRAVDTTGAGDAFNGALAAFLAEGLDLEAAIPLASAVGALTCTKRGAQEAMPTRAEIENLGF